MKRQLEFSAIQLPFRRLRPEVAISCGAVAIVFALVVASPNRPIWDELYYLDNCQELIEKGFGTRYLNEFSISTGPLFAFIHSLPYAASNGNVKTARAVNVALWGCATFLIYRCQLVAPGAGGHVSPAAWLFAPMTWPAAGLAMTEGPTIVALLLSLLVANRCTKRTSQNLALAVGAGILAGLAGLSRQIAITALLPLSLFIGTRSRSIGVMVLFVVIAVLPPLGLFAIWHGPIAPGMKAVGGDRLNMWHGIVSTAYLGFAVTFIDARFLTKGLTLTVVLGVAAASAFCALITKAEFLPMKWLFERVSDVWQTPLPSFFIAKAGIYFIAFLTLAAFSRFAYQNRKNAMAVTAIGSAVVLSFAACTVASQFSSRYVVLSIPFVVIAFAGGLSVPGLTQRFLNICGTGLGALILVHYYFDF